MFPQIGVWVGPLAEHGQAQRFQRAGAAVLAGFYFGSIAPRKVSVHLIGQRQGGLPKFRRERNTLAAAGFFVKECISLADEA